ncbi:MAG: phosphate ABC transporter substrate-binding protein PstS [Candidatus Omnitrophica bacterium]|nr:phosphate ABC transporter substrate-binding protein PstS [Candidatus Omnitrophota bacterium]
MKRKLLKRFIVVLLAALVLGGNYVAKAADNELIGAGASFPYALYSKMFDAYQKEKGIKVNYSSIGSGGGIRQLMAKTVDFGGSDAYLTDEQMKQMEPVLHIPICMGAVVLAYNLSGVNELNLTPELVSDIFLGKIKKWNDPKIQKLNPKAKLPDMNIVTVHRSDGSGTTFIFTDYLSNVSQEWKDKVGCGTAVNWPCGLGSKGNTGVAGLVKQIPSSIGYVELIYALSNKIPFANVQNKSGNFIKPTLASTSASANIKLPDDMRVSITNTDASDGYPISGFTWILVYKEQNYGNRTFEKAKTLVDLLWWMTHQGQKYTEELHYAPLSKEAVKKAENLIKLITYDGKNLIK